MEKQAPSIGRILVAVGFALSCFGLLLFLWLAFGGPVPLKAQSYRISADFPEAFTLTGEADVRIGGVTVGKVKGLELAPQGNPGTPEATRAELEIDEDFAPISTDARAILRTKTLVGETYVELTAGTPPGSQPASLGAGVAVSDAEAASADPIPEGGQLADARVADATQIDEIFNALDERTRASFQRWQANAAIGIEGRGRDLNDAIGNLDPFLFDANELLEVLDEEEPEVRGLVRDTGTVFGALTEHEEGLAGLITDSDRAFGALASQERALADTVRIFPTFEREARATLERLDRFRGGAEPLVDDLIPAARDLSPTLRSVKRFSPGLERLFGDLDVLLEESKLGLPALSRTLNELRPMVEALEPFLANVVPVVHALRLYRNSLTDFLAGPPSGVADTLPKQEGQPAPRHVLRQYAYASPEILAIFPERLSTNRGNGYPAPLSLTNHAAASSGIFEAFDCKNTDYTPVSADTDEDEVRLGQPSPPDVNSGDGADAGFAPCIIAPGFEDYGFGTGRAPIFEADD